MSKLFSILSVLLLGSLSMEAAFSGCICHLVPKSQKLCQQAKGCGAPEDDLCYKEPGFNYPGCKNAGGSLRPSEQQRCLQDLVDYYCEG